MFPVLISIGFIKITSLAFFSFLATLMAMFVFYRRAKEEHYSEFEAVDAFLLTFFVGALGARLGFIVLNFNTFSLQIFKWLDLLNYGGFNLIIGLCVASFYMYKHTIKMKWDNFEVMDIFVTALAFGLSIYHFGTFLAGIGYGVATNFPFGVTFPQLLEPHHPVQIYQAIAYFLIYLYLIKLEFSYRTFEWYRFGKKTAQTGFLTGAFLCLVGLTIFTMSFIKNSMILLEPINLDMILGLFFLCFGIVIFYVRSGRPVPSFFKEKTKPLQTKIEDLQK